MKAVILAAGLGSRLRPITDEVPKCMVPVNGIKIIDKQIDNLISNGLTDIVVIAGYKADVLIFHLKENYPNVQVIINTRYSETNNMYSLYLSHNYVKEDSIILMNADVYFESNIISGLLFSNYPNQIACDNRIFLEESMKISVVENKINRISKKIEEQDAFAVSIDIYKMSKEGVEILFDEIINIIEIEKDENSWTEIALDHIFNKIDFIPYIINHQWVEIDNHEDLSMAEVFFKDDQLCRR